LTLARILSRPVIPLSERNRQILEMRKGGVSQRDVAERFGLSASRIYLLERRDAAKRAADERRGKILEAMRAADDPEKLWPIHDVADALGPGRVVRNSLLKHFANLGRDRISLGELMKMCLNAPDGLLNVSWPPLMRVCGIGRQGFWSVVSGLTNAGLGDRCSEEWGRRLDQVKDERNRP
jgi:DNA-binding CsgD family transcriptional regulator